MLGWPALASAGSVTGKVELPAPPERAAVKPKGFLERVENPLKPPQSVPIAPYMVIVLEGGAAVTPPQATWQLVGESFDHPVFAAMAGAEVVIKNVSKTPHTLSSVEDPNLVPHEPINPTGPKSFKAPEAGKVVTIHDTDMPYFWGRLVTTSSPYIAYVDETGPNAATFSLPDVPDGTYKVRVFYKDAWLDLDQSVTVAKKTDVTIKIPALTAPAKK